MIPRERVEATFAGRTPDRPAVHHIGFCSSAASAMLGREAYVGGGIQRWREARSLWSGPDAHAEFLERSYRDAVDLAIACGNDIVRPSYWRCPRKPSRLIDENTFVFEQGPEENWQVLKYDPPSEQCAIVPYLPESKPTFEDLERGIEAKERSLDDYRPNEGPFAFEIRAMAELGDERTIRIGGNGMGIPHDHIWMEAIALRPDLCRRRLAVLAETTVRNLEFLTAKGFRYFFGGYDFSSQTGPMFSPAMFRELMLGPLQKVSAACRRLGVYNLFASDGNLWSVADTLFGESGVDGYYEIDRRADMDLRALRGRFDSLTLVGNISSHTVHLGTREEIVAEVRDCVDVARELGRVVVGISNYVVPGTPPENVRTMCDSVVELIGQ